MLCGTADPGALAVSAPTVKTFDVAPQTFGDALVFQTLYEMRYAERLAVLPPALHPTNPPTLVVQAWSCQESPWGAFDLAQLRIGCRSGVRSRGFLVGAVVSDERAGAALAEHWGYPIRPGQVRLEPRYDGLALEVFHEEACILAFEALDPDPLAPGDIQYTGTLNLAHTPRGLRLVQVEPTYTLERAERLTAQALWLDPEAWGQPLLTPYHPVSASLGRGRIDLPAPRFLCRPDVLAFTGTEPVG